MAVAFVTGAGKGIGRAITERLISAGWEVAGITRSPTDVAALNALPGARFIAADATDASAVEWAARELIADDGTVDLLVNNAGAFAYGRFEETDADGLEALWRANVLAPFLVTRALLPALRRAHGQIVNIVSLAAIKPLAGKAAYSATKAAQAVLFRCLREEVAQDGVRVSNIHPGVTYTSSFEGEDVDPAALMAPSDVAEAVFAAAVQPGNAVVEELVLQPARGMRL